MNDRYLLAVALGTFHAVVVTLLLVLGLYLTIDLGHLLSSFSTIIGLGIFGELWATSVYCTHRGLREAGLAPGQTAPADFVLSKGLSWGAWNGMLFFWVLLAAGAVAVVAVTIVDGNAQQVFGIFIFGLVAFAAGSIVAAGIGASTGILLAALDIQLLRAARSLVVTGEPNR